MKPPSVCAIIINWNGKIDTSECLFSLEKVSTKYASLSIAVVDNHSTDGSLHELEKRFPKVVFIRNKENAGFAGGNNTGMRYAKDQHVDYIWLLNNDTVVDIKVLSAVTSFYNPSVGAVGSKIYFSKGYEFHTDWYEKKDLGHVLWYAGGCIDWQNMFSSHRGVDEVDRGQYEKEMITEYVTGCSFFIRTDLLNRIGYFDESYFMYMEDVDYSLRIQRAGYTTVYNPTSVLWHKNASSTGGSGSSLHEYYQTRNRLKIGMTYAPPRTKFALIREGIRILGGGSTVKKRAVIDYISGRMGQYHE